MSKEIESLKDVFLQIKIKMDDYKCESVPRQKNFKLAPVRSLRSLKSRNASVKTEFDSYSLTEDKQ